MTTSYVDSLAFHAREKSTAISRWIAEGCKPSSIDSLAWNAREK